MTVVAFGEKLPFVVVTLGSFEASMNYKLVICNDSL